MDMINGAESQTIYDQFWAESQAALARNDVQADGPATVEGKRWGISVILPLSGPVAERLATTAAELGNSTGPQHVLYNTQTLHVTVFTLEFYREPIPDHDPLARQYLEALAAVAVQLRPAVVHFRGLTATRMGVIVQGWQMNETVVQARQLYREELARRDVLDGPELTMNRQIAHASLVVFSGPLRHAQKVVDFIAAHRDTDFGTCIIDELQLVRYIKTLISVEIVPLGRVTISQAEGGNTPSASKPV